MPVSRTFRFPQWLFCGQCRQMIRWSPRREKQGEPASLRDVQEAPAACAHAVRGRMRKRPP